MLVQKFQVMSCAVLTTVLLLNLYRKKKSLRKHKIKKIWTRKWLQRRDCDRGLSNLVFNELAVEDEKSFKHLTRLSLNAFNDLLRKVEPKICRQNTILRECISAKTRLLLTLRYLATGETFHSLQYSFRISVPAISLIIAETIEVIYEVLHTEYLCTPTTQEQWKNVASRFEKLWNFPNCLGALDGKHIAFKAKKTDGSFYFNYKGFNSIVLLALVDAEYNFLYVDVGCNGRSSDGGVYKNSSLFSAIQNNTLNFPEDSYLPNSDIKVPYVIVADDAFKLTRNFMKPWGQRSAKEQKIFNYRLSRARRIVENAFGILANRFQILQTDINLSVHKVQSVVLTCCVLHNFIKSKDGTSYMTGLDNENTDTITLNEGEWRQNSYITGLEKNNKKSGNEAIEIRQKFTDYFNGIGFVPWQWEAIKKFNF